MNISAWSIRNPVPAVLLFALVTLLGIAGFRALGIQHFPDIEVPVVTITASLEGADPTQLETEIARKIEDKIATLGGIEHIRTTITDGTATIAVEFNIDKDSESAVNDVRNAVDSVRAELPQDMTDPVIAKTTTSGSPILTFTVRSGQMDEEALSWFVDNEISKAMLAVKGVGAVKRVGGVDREIAVDLDPVRMAALGVTAADVSARLRQVEKDHAGGRGDIGGAIQSVRTLGAVGTAADLGAVEIPLGNGRRVRLDEIATIRDTFAERSAYTYQDGKPVVGFQITRLKGASEVAVAEATRKAVAEFQKRHPQATIAEAFDTVAPVEDNYVGSMQLLYEGAILAILVVWWFLRDWRATLVSAAALPLSIIPTFAVMHFLDFSLNTLTLLALALVVGILVDDAIVEVENIVRHLRMGKPPRHAAIDAAGEIGLAVIATSLSLVAVFLPTAFMGGVPGKFFRPFGITAAVAVLASLAVARLLTPMMAAYFLKAHHTSHSDGLIMRRYMALATWCMAHRKTTVAAAMLFFVGSMALLPMLPKGFIPAADRNQTAINLELPPGSSLDDTRDISLKAAAIAAANPAVIGVFTRVGASSGMGGPFGGGTNADVRKSILTLTLKHRQDRPDTQAEVENELREALRVLPGVRVSVGTGEAGEKLQLVLAGEDPDMLYRAALNVERDLRTLSGLGNITSSASLQRPEIHVVPDFARAADLNVTTADLAEVVRVATAGDFKVQLPKLNLPQRQVPIRVRLDKEARVDLDAVRQLRVPSRSGEVPLESVAEVKLDSGPTQIDRMDRKRNVTIDIELAGQALGAVQGQVNQLPSMLALPPGIELPASGDAQRMGEVFASFGSAMGIGILCIYVVLVLLFHDFLQPVTILAALPLSLGGAFIALLLTHNSFSMPSVIGVLMLMGIVSKNSILLVEYAVMARRQRGLNRMEALMDACHKRARPILMTTIAMVAGMLPIALGLGAEPSFRAPMAVAVIGGLITSTFLSLLVIPVVFTYVDDLLELIKRATAKLRPADTHLEPAHKS